MKEQTPHMKPMMHKEEPQERNPSLPTPTGMVSRKANGGPNSVKDLQLQYIPYLYPGTLASISLTTCSVLKYSNSRIDSTGTPAASRTPWRT